MILKQLLASLPVYKSSGNLDVDITSITADSRKVKAGSLFIALVGHNTDGHRYVQQAVENGAIALLLEQGRSAEPMEGVTVIEVSDTRRALAILASAYYGHPSKKLRLIGVTGTNGKTTTTYLIHRILSEHGYKTGLIGTIQTVIGEERFESKNTTPESIELQEILAKMVDAGCSYAVMEVSSHALAQGRVRGAHFSSAIFTNLTQDHLDYHQTMDEYLRTKGLLFSQLGNDYDKRVRPAILNADDPASSYYAKITAAPVITYGIENDADVHASDIKISSHGLTFHLDTWKGSQQVELKMTGKFNIYNALAAIAALLIEGLPLPSIVSSLARIEGVNGRFEKVDAGQNFTVIVDYSHTPDSLYNALATIRQFAEGRVITIVGCGGERDPGKRPQMARIAAELSDYAILTSDNPRREDPLKILEDMVAGLTEHDPPYQNYEVIVDRKEAIRRGVAMAEEHDVLLIAGKGHENYQDLGHQVIHFDDREEAILAIRSLHRA